MVHFDSLTSKCKIFSSVLSCQMLKKLFFCWGSLCGDNTVKCRRINALTIFIVQSMLLRDTDPAMWSVLLFRSSELHLGSWWVSDSLSLSCLHLWRHHVKVGLLLMCSVQLFPINLFQVHFSCHLVFYRISSKCVVSSMCRFIFFLMLTTNC